MHQRQWGLFLIPDGHRGALIAVMLLGLATGADLATGCDAERSVPAAPRGTSGAGGSSATSSTGSAAGGASSGGGGADGGGLPSPREIAHCGGPKIYECGDLIDNDSDGLIDYQDPECLGACDNSEDSLWPDMLTSQGQPCDISCFWLGSPGHYEGCYWNHACDPHANDQSAAYSGTPSPQSKCSFSGSEEDQQTSMPPGDPSGLTCAEMFASQGEDCLDACLPITPNGCDCFGCCELDGVFVWLGSLDHTNLFGECDLSDVGQPNFLEHCHPCTPVPACHNACDTCELCVGKGVLPPECGSEQICPPGAPACGLVGQPLCPSGTYCITGCCQPLPP